MKCSRIAVAIFALSSAALRADGITALDAVKLLPPGKAARLAWIEGRDADPEPARWYLIVQDEFAENGFEEYVVNGSQVVATRIVSQFVTSLAPADIIGVDSIRIDSSEAGRIAVQYASANNVKYSKLNFELKRAGENAVPVWKVTCMDASGAALGEVTLTTGKGTVISHEGFKSEPEGMTAQAPSRKKKKAPSGRLLPVAQAVAVATPASAEPANTSARRPGAFTRFLNYIAH